ncbi:MAG: O-antigen ligase family protein [Actinomycetota bacterium]|nr:O-antigen ligase family protein [Actinomycetota bacterium]
MSARAARIPSHPLLWVALAGLLGAAAGMGAGVDPKVTVVAVVGIAALIALFLRPDWVPAALIVTMFMEGIALGGVQITRLVAPLAAAIVLIRLAAGGAVRFPRRSVLLAVGAYSAWAFASVLWTVNPDSSFSQNGTGYALASLALSVVFLFAMAVLVESRRDVRRVMAVMWLMSVLAGLVAIGEFATGAQRAVGYTGDANFFAATQVIALPIGVALSGQIEERGKRLVVLLGTAVAIGSIFTSLSRGGILALSAVLLVLAFQPASQIFRARARKRAFFLTAVVGGAVLLSFSYGALSARTSSLFQTKEGGSGRTYLWKAALTGFKEHPGHGLGFGAFDSQSNFLLERTPGVDFSSYRLRQTGQVVHNAYLSSLTELGVLGLALFLAMFGTTFATLRRVARRAEADDDPPVAALARALILSLAGFMLVSIFLSSETDRALWVVMGLALALGRLAPPHGLPAPLRRGHLLASGRGRLPRPDWAPHHP